ncbi:MAG: M14-type cytosolic carboxypeptidase [Pseudohongiellaceae bacterium]
MFISQNFDAGNIEVVSCERADDIRLNIRKDAHSDFYQWFYFRLTGARGQTCNIQILNARDAAYPPGFRDYRVLYSYDRQTWTRHDTSLVDGALRIEFTPQQDAVYFAYFVPYSMERHHELVAGALQSPLCSHQLLGQSLDGQDLDLLTISKGGDKERKRCWIIARQHPGETMGGWWMEGCIDTLLGGDQKLASALLERCDIHLIANMNPDGSRRGHLRTNAAGRNLNREWAHPTYQHSPEVKLAKEAMLNTGVDFLLDVHGDESLPYCFIAGTEGLLHWSKKEQAQLDFYKNRLAELNSDFQTEKGYPPKQPGEANLTMSTAQTAHLHHCLAMTLEMPFKDTTATPDTEFGWSPQRSKRLAQSCLQALLDYLNSGLI